jgi:hypothetical protein
MFVIQEANAGFYEQNASPATLRAGCMPESGNKWLVKPESLAIQQQSLNGTLNGRVAGQRLSGPKRGASDI